MIPRQLICFLLGLVLSGVFASGAVRAQDQAASEIRQDYALWQLLCSASANPDAPPCELRQLLKNSQNQFVAGLFYTEVKNVGVFMLRVAPALDDKLKSGVMFQADNGLGTDAFRYTGCDQLGCVSQVAMKRVVVSILENAQVINVKIGPSGPSPFEVGFRLDGFQDAIAALRQHNK